MSFYVLLLITLTHPATVHHSTLEQEALTAINQLRRSGCTCGGRRMAPAPPVEMQEQLRLSARLHAKQMQRYRFFEHYSLGGLDVGQRARAVGYNWRTIGENLARGQTNISQVIHDWINSTTHCHVLMNPKFREMGFARSGPYWVLHMGIRKQAYTVNP